MVSQCHKNEHSLCEINPLSQVLQPQLRIDRSSWKETQAKHFQAWLLEASASKPFSSQLQGNLGDLCTKLAV